MIKCIIIDDQKDAVELLVDHASKRKELNVVATFNDPLLALSYLEENVVELVFIDIKMPNLTGLEFIESMRAKHGNNIPNFILTTGFDEYALPGFEHGATDYLLKPIGEKRFRIAIDRYLSKKLSTSPEAPKDDFFFADLNGKKQKINFTDISFIESAGNYVSVFGDNNLKAVIYNSMNGMQDIVPADNFMRVHKSYIVSIRHINAVKGNTLIMRRNGTEIDVPMGVTFKSNALKKLKIKD